MPRRSSRKAEIIAIFQAHGGKDSLRRITQYCWEEGVWTEEEQHNKAFHACMRDVQQALNAKDVRGLPIAGPSAERQGRERIWKQPEMWDYEDAQYNLGMRLRQAYKDYATIEAIEQYMRERWGEAPPIPHLDYPEDLPMWWNDRFADDEEDDEC